MNRKSWFLGLAVILAATAAQAKLRLPALIGDHMVLQSGKPVVWGWADAGQKVTVTLNGKKASATADADGKWKAILNCPKPGGPFDMVLQGDEAVTVSDVLIGDVWLGSGQSNMEFTVQNSTDGPKAVQTAEDPKLRLFQVERVASMTPLDDVQGHWTTCTPASVGDFSAVAYYFGREIQGALKVPVGLVKSCWGGTAAESWTPRAALDADPAFADILKQWDNDQSQIKTWTQGDDVDLWLSDIRFVPRDAKDKPLTVSAAQAAQLLGGNWMTSVKPGCSGSVTVEGKAHSGVGPAVHFSGAMKGGGWGTVSTNLSAGPLDLSKYQTAEFYEKGKGKYRMTLGQPSIGDYDYYATDVFDATEDWHLVQADLPNLKQGGWGAPKPFTPESITTMNFAVQVPYWPDVASAVYNAMGAPLTPMRLKGVLWYQGESNTGRSDRYQELLTTLIRSWRSAWGERFPFIVIQLPNFMGRQANPSESGWARLREAQRLTAKTVPGVGLVTTIDLGEENNIHPHNKTDVGHRAALVALHDVYGKKIVPAGPLFRSAKAKGAEVTVLFDNNAKGLKTSDGAGITGFALEDADGRYHWAQARVVGKGLVVSSPDVPKPYGIRYAWADNPACNLVNSEGLPATPFEAELAKKPAPKPGAGDDIPPPPVD